MSAELIAEARAAMWAEAGSPSGDVLRRLADELEAATADARDFRALFTGAMKMADEMRDRLDAVQHLHQPTIRTMPNGPQTYCGHCGIGWTLWPCREAVALGLAEEPGPSRLQRRFSAGVDGDPT